MSNIVTAASELINTKMMFKGTSRDNPPVVTDYTPPAGDGKGYTSLELFLVSLSSCLGGALSVMLRKTGKTLDALTINAEGVRREQHPTCFEKITLSVRVRSKDITEADVRKAVDISEASVCPIWAMIKGNVEVETNITVEK